MELLSETNQTSLWWTGPGLNLNTWIWSLLASCAVGLSGVMPLIFVPDIKKNNGDNSALPLLLSFAVGSLLGDVFLHLLPEAWQDLHKDSAYSNAHMRLGAYVLLGMFSFVAIEIMFTIGKAKEEEGKLETEKLKIPLDGNQNVPVEYWPKEYQNGIVTQRHKSPCTLVSESDTKRHKSPCTQNVSESDTKKESNSKHIAGYLNLVANAIDNFSHGLAVAASFIVGTKMGLLTTAAILIHEIPHEVGDFAILLKSGFNRWEAAKAQFSTALIGVAGALFALTANSMEDVGKTTNWILPFTAGGFLNIALVNILPELLKEQDPWKSLKQLMAIFLGIAVMGTVGLITE